ncbi:hypothetical protein [Chryseobacterium sp.]|uniref:hypothetical protein n=1 Tax=Chryseobacterium sp. TaxID=1871047 RepID=UPI002FC61E6C
MKTNSMEIQNKKFQNLTTDEETKILFRQQTIFNGYDAMMESWIWDGIEGQSVIFYSNDVKNLTDEELMNLIKEHYKNETFTISRNNADYVFLNFNFMITK